MDVKKDFQMWWMLYLPSGQVVSHRLSGPELVLSRSALGCLWERDQNEANGEKKIELEQIYSLGFRIWFCLILIQLIK